MVHKKISRGILIAFEGIDGAGKSTQARKLSQYLKDKGYQSILLHEPSNSRYGLKLKESALNGRHDPHEELKYFIEDRKLDVQNNIKPALEANKIVIMDRYYFSTIAYQGAAEINIDHIRKLNEKFAPRPDLTIILDVAPTIGLSRIQNHRNDSPNHFEKREYLEKVRQFFKKMEDPSVQIIDGARDVNKVSEEIINMVLNILKPIERTEVEISR